MKNHNPVLRRLCEYGVILLGSAIYAVAFNWFFQPNNISMGGFTGIAQIINRLVPALPVGVLAIVLNIPLFMADQTDRLIGLVMEKQLR